MIDKIDSGPDFEKLKPDPLGILRNRLATWDHRHLDVFFVLALAALSRVTRGTISSEETKVASEILHTMADAMDTNEVILKYGAKPEGTPPPLALDIPLFEKLVRVSDSLFDTGGPPPPGREEFLNAFQDDELTLQVLQWIQKSRRVYEISGNNVRLYNELDFKQWTWGKIVEIFPFDSFIVQFPTVLQLGSGQFVQVHGVLVSKLNSTDPSFPDDQIEIQPILSPFHIGGDKKLIKIREKDRPAVLKAIQAATKAMSTITGGKTLPPNYLQSVNATFHSGSEALRIAREDNAAAPEIHGKVFRISLNEPIVDASLSVPINLMRRVVAAVCLEKMYVKSDTSVSPPSEPGTVSPKNNPPPLVIPPGARNRTVDSIFSDVNIVRETVGDTDSKVRLQRAISEHDREAHVRRPRGMGHIPWEQIPMDKLVKVKATRVLGRLRRTLDRDIIPPTTKKRLDS